MVYLYLQAELDRLSQQKAYLESDHSRLFEQKREVETAHERVAEQKRQLEEDHRRAEERQRELERTHAQMAAQAREVRTVGLWLFGFLCRLCTSLNQECCKVGISASRSASTRFEQKLLGVVYAWFGGSQSAGFFLTDALIWARENRNCTMGQWCTQAESSTAIITSDF